MINYVSNRSIKPANVIPYELRCVSLNRSVRLDWWRQCIILIQACVTKENSCEQANAGLGTRYRLVQKNSNAGFLGNRFLSCKLDKPIFDGESPVNRIEAHDLGDYTSGPLTKLEILDKGCSAAFARRIIDIAQRSSSLHVRETRRAKHVTSAKGAW